MPRRATIVIARHLDGDAAFRAREDALVACCMKAGWDVLVVPHLYHLPSEHPLWPELASRPVPVGVAMWVYPRPAEWLLHEHGVEPVIVVDLNVSAADDAFAQLASALPKAPGAGEVREYEYEDEIRERWYPIIDRSRCIGCRHCLQFCLFGVYELDEKGRVVTAQPDNCKSGCPACARICPQGAIIFPLCDEPAIAGAPGTLMEPDAAARRMFYVRSGLPCPVCGQVAEAGRSGGAASCPECGSPRDEDDASDTRSASPVYDEIDALIDSLDEIAGGGGR